MRLPRFGVVALVGVLAVVQAYALATQFKDGFRPFGRAPTRVPYSWDMFAVRIDRCGAEFDPPLQVGNHRLRRLHDTAAPIEWDTIYSQVSSYEFVMKAVCNDAQYHGSIDLRCFTPDGPRNVEVDC